MQGFLNCVILTPTSPLHTFLLHWPNLLTVGTDADVELAVSCAKKAFESWSKLPGGAACDLSVSLVSLIGWCVGLCFSPVPSLIPLFLPPCPSLYSLLSLLLHSPSFSLPTCPSPPTPSILQCPTPLLTGHVRARHLYSVARHVQKHMRLLSVLESMDNGKPIRESRDCDIPLVARHLYHHSGWAQLMEEEMSGWGPVGVVGAIVPWNFPLMLLSWKVILHPRLFLVDMATIFYCICCNTTSGQSLLNSYNKVEEMCITVSTGVEL